MDKPFYKTLPPMPQSQAEARRLIYANDVKTVKRNCAARLPGCPFVRGGEDPCLGTEGKTKTVKLFADRPVAFAGDFFQGFPVADVHLAARILHKPGLLQDSGRPVSPWNAAFPAFG
jgi:hypothetical protein